MHSGRQKMINMKKALLILTALFFFSFQSDGQTKRALIVAIGNYPKSSKWEELNSVNDVSLLQNALMKQNFPQQHISILTDSMATKTGIEKALDRLIDSSGTGDIVMIYFSSHGEQIEDDDHDEVDGLDECIVPYDAIYSTDKATFKKLAPGYFRDDTFGSKVTLLRNKLGKTGDILVGIDACHSGTGTRGVDKAKVRGGNDPMVSENFDQKKFNGSDTAGVFKDNNSTKLNSDAANYVVISASQAKEKNKECYDDDFNPVGSLSYAISKALNSLDGKITYRNLFAQIEDEMRTKVPQQTPVMEGDGIDYELFGGKYVRQEPYFTVNMQLSNSKTVVLNAGTVSGITIGSIINFYPAGTADPDTLKLLQKGTITAANNFTSTVTLLKEDTVLLKKIPWAFVTETSYGKNKIILNIDSLGNEPRQNIKEGLKSFQLIEFKPAYDLYFGRSTSSNGWALKYSGSGVVFADDVDLADAAALKNLLKRFDRFRYLRNLKFAEQGLSAKVELIFLDKTGNVDLKKIQARIKFGRLELREGDSVYLRIINTGLKKFYINIVDIQPDGIINPIIPNKALKDINNNPTPIKWQDCEVMPKAEIIFKNNAIRIAPPYGEETFKIFLSSDALDLEDILTGNGDKNSTSRGVLNNLAKIFEESVVNEAGTRGGPGKINTAQNGTIFSLNFSILPK